MRVLSILVIGLALVACGGVTSDPLGDGGNTDAPNEASLPLCNGHACAGYCIHPSTTSCPTCTYAPDSGACPPDSTLDPYCPAGPPMQGGPFCVYYPTPDPPFCSDTIPDSCFPMSTPTDKPSEVDCMEALCGA
jgi:hypothetical protein